MRNLNEVEVIYIKAFVVAIIVIITTIVIHTISYDILMELGIWVGWAITAIMWIGLNGLIREIGHRIFSKYRQVSDDDALVAEMKEMFGEEYDETEKYGTWEKAFDIISKIITVVGALVLGPLVNFLVIGEKWLKDFGVVAIVTLSIVIPYVVWQFIKKNVRTTRK